MCSGQRRQHRPMRQDLRYIPKLNSYAAELCTVGDRSGLLLRRLRHRRILVRGAGRGSYASRRILHGADRGSRHILHGLGILHWLRRRCHWLH